MWDEYRNRHTYVYLIYIYEMRMCYPCTCPITTPILTYYDTNMTYPAAGASTYRPSPFDTLKPVATQDINPIDFEMCRPAEAPNQKEMPSKKSTETEGSSRIVEVSKQVYVCMSVIWVIRLLINIVSYCHSWRYLRLVASL